MIYSSLNKGFTIIEALLAIFLITMAVIGIFGLISYTTSSTSLVFNKLPAAYLAQEAMEIVRNIRDTNKLQGEASGVPLWNDGLTDCALPQYCCELDYKTDTPDSYPALASLSDCDREGEELYNYLSVLNIDDDGFYSYSAGNPTKFKRKINITENEQDSDILEIKIEVLWQDRSKKVHNLIAYTHLYNW